ncbi:septin-2-like, partial [Megalops cyprinoides]|uniref:septin-2-like n=1 Tax=Megalops cyprinoides TaxID=118141 RepID=UPI0018653BDC
MTSDSLNKLNTDIRKEKIECTVHIEASAVEIEERGVKLRRTVVVTPGSGDNINSQDCLEPMDVQIMKALHNKVGLVPVITKADTLTLREPETQAQGHIDRGAHITLRLCLCH